MFTGIYIHFKTNPSKPLTKRYTQIHWIYKFIIYLYIRYLVYIIKDEALNIHVWITVNDDRKGIYMLVGKLINEQLKLIHKKEVWSLSIYTTPLRTWSKKNCNFVVRYWKKNAMRLLCLLFNLRGVFLFFLVFGYTARGQRVIEKKKLNKRFSFHCTFTRSGLLFCKM